MPKDRKIVSNPPGIAPPFRPTYSNAVVALPGPLLFVSGMVAWDKDRNLVGPGDIKAQTEQTLGNLKTVLEAHGGSLDDVVKLTVFVTDLGAYAETSEIRARFFPKDPPASTIVEVSALVLPELMVEIEAVAVVQG